MGNNQIGVIFVCTGNICRSPTAEAVFRSKVQKAGLEQSFLIDSAGTHGYHIGDPPDPRSIETALARGVDMRDLRARKFAADDFDRFDYVLAMDSGHYDLLSRYGGANRLKLFLEFPMVTSGSLRDVPDPYYGRQKGFEDVFDLIEQGCERILTGVRAIHGL